MGTLLGRNRPGGEESVGLLGGTPPDKSKKHLLVMIVVQESLFWETCLPGGLEGSGGESCFSSLFWLIIV